MSNRESTVQIVIRLFGMGLLTFGVFAVYIFLFEEEDFLILLFSIPLVLFGLAFLLNYENVSNKIDKKIDFLIKWINS
jgi:hypothetical protein